MKPVSKTAFYCCGVRALDARAPRPVCGDHLAERFMDDEAWASWAPFAETKPANASNVARHRIIDDLLRARLADDPAHRVVTIGAGFDTRPYRLRGGRWLEWDEPLLMGFKEERLPARESPNPLERQAIDFGSESLAERLRPYATDEAVTVVVEGVMMYLTTEQVRALTHAVRATFPRVTLLTDLMTYAFFQKYGQPVYQHLHALGATFVLAPEHPRELIQKAGFRALGSHSMIERAVREKAFPWLVPSWALKLFLRTMRDGYAVWEFQAP